MVTKNFVVAYPGNPLAADKDPNVSSYFNITILPPDSDFITCYNPSGVYVGWCFDVYDEINPGQDYTAKFISMLDPNAWTTFAAAIAAMGPSETNQYIKPYHECKLPILGDFVHLQSNGRV